MGRALIRHIRSSGQKSYTYIIMLTAIDDKPKVVMGLESGADEYLTKPFDNMELIARVASGERIIKLAGATHPGSAKWKLLPCMMD